jgi:prepilin-type N-terminal cleavage/methylation domain-containing protein
MKKGFTLIELLVVIAIIAILSVIGLTSFRTASKIARDGKRKGDVSQVRAALELYKTEFNSYPVHAGQSNASYVSAVADLKTAKYLADPVPVDPKNASPYQYTYNSAGTTYCLCADLENGGGNSTGSCAGSSGTYYCLTQP